MPSSPEPEDFSAWLHRRADQISEGLTPSKAEPAQASRGTQLGRVRVAPADDSSSPGTDQDERKTLEDVEAGRDPWGLRAPSKMRPTLTIGDGFRFGIGLAIISVITWVIAALVVAAVGR